MDFSKLLSMGPLNSSPPARLPVVPKTGVSPRWNDAQIDPKIIVRPTQSKLGVQPTGTIIAKNEFPNLRFLPIASSGSSSYAIPAQWPGSKLEAIPTTWPKFKLSLVQGAKQAAPPPPAK
ncbi:MAG: hypothetical protein ACLQM6_14580 [Acidobacteriaceae bacterium]